MMGRIKSADGKSNSVETDEDSKKTDPSQETAKGKDEQGSPTTKNNAGDDQWGMDVIWDTSGENVCTPCNQTVQYYTCFGFFEGWSALERNFFLLLLGILCYQLHFFSFFHSSDISIGLKYETPVLPSEREAELFGEGFPKIDLLGVNWAPIYKRETQLCVNLDSIIKATDTVTSEERKLWAKLKCQEELKDLYRRW